MKIDSIVGVPIDSSGQFDGCERMPAALRAAGLNRALLVPDLGNLQVVIADPIRDPETGIVGLHDIINLTDTVRSAIAAELAAGRKPLIVGGCCTLLLGVTAALHDVAPGAGMVFIDGHLDFYSPTSSPTGMMADMELAVMLGIGPAELTGLTGRDRLINEDRVHVLGARDLDDAAANGAPDPTTCAPEMLVLTDTAILRRTPNKVAIESISRLTTTNPTFWIHLDLDVLSTDALPAVDFQQAGGLTWQQLIELTQPMVNHPGFLGMDVTILNPTLDTDGSSAAKTVKFLSDLLN